MSDLKDAALDYSARGFRVIPVEPRGKKPLIEWRKYQHEQASPEQISHWWDDDWPDANVALVLGEGIFAVDVDAPDGHHALTAAGITFAASTPHTLTGRGVHYFFHGNQPDRVGLVPHVDIRGKGIVVVPPSRHANGKVYRWLQGLDTLGEAPFALLSLLARPPAPQTAPEGGSWLLEALKGVGEGLRDSTCTRLAGYYLSKGIPHEVVLADLLAWGQRCTPSFPPREVAKCVASIAQKEGPHQPFETLSVEALYQGAPDTHEWLWDDYVPVGSLVLLASEEKVGKSTFIYALAAAIAQGRTFLDRAVKQSRVLILAVEEHPVDVKIRSMRFGLQSGDGVQYFIGNLGGDVGTHQKLKNFILDNGIGLVVLDTMGHYLSGFLDSENESFGVLKGLKPFLQLARETKAAVLLIHHTGKGAIQAYRGASSIGGIVDQILTLRHAGGNTRTLTAKGRYNQTPEKLWISLDGAEYSVVHVQERE